MSARMPGSNDQAGWLGMVAPGRPAWSSHDGDQLMVAVKVPPFWKETLPPLQTSGTLMDPW